MRVGEVSRCCNSDKFRSALAPQTGGWREDPAERKASLCYPCRDKACAVQITRPRATSNWKSDFPEPPRGRRARD